ncbi:MAG: carbohydrate-binding protein [Cytophagaceae bacterium]|nr:carbohydrate-binding protein [Cytophagaceae bacterium]
MKTITKFYLLLFVLLGAYSSVVAQHDESSYSLGGTEGFVKDIKEQLSAAAKQKKSGKPVIQQRVSATENFSLSVNLNKSENANDQYLAGQVSAYDSSSFFIKVTDGKLEGNIIFRKEKKAFKYFSDEKGNAFVEPVDIHDIICIEYKAVSYPTPSKNKIAALNPAVSDLQSFPGARGCVLLDFDGQYVSGTPWNNGNPINAQPSGMSDAAIQEAWELISEDFRPFHLNITTNEAVFNSYPKTMRMRCIFTPTNTAAPGAGGVAYIGSFNWNDDTPCWVFILSGKAGGEAASHEIGHTFGLGHDGRINPSEGYFAGHGDWAPIMGVGYYKNITQWSRGEYNSANNTEDDLAMISSATYNVGYRNDDHGNATTAATSIPASSNVNRSGIIERTSDVDYFSFNSGSGTINLNINTVYRHPDLDIIARLYNSSGALIGTYNPAGVNASLSINVSQGIYYLSVDGTGTGNPATDGYSDYASLGSYTITGSIPVPVNPTTGIAVVYRDCNFSGAAVGLDAGDYTLAQLSARGILNDDISSLKVNLGYEVVLYENDNFTGASVSITIENACLVNNGWNDRATSIRVRTTGVTNLSGLFFLQNRYSGLYMDVTGGTGDGANIAQWSYNGQTNQQFEFVHLGNGVYRINAKHSGKSMDVAGVSTADGANVQQWTYGGGANQQFIVQSTGDGYYKLIAKHSSKIVEVAGFGTQAGDNVQQWSNVNQASGQWKLVVVNTNFSNLIEAENYSVMSGVQTEATADAGGGLNVGWIDAGDWMAYNNINFPTSGAYTIEYRVASLPGGGRLSVDLNGGTIVLGALNIPATGGWQNWVTVSHTVNVNAGTYNLGIYAAAGGWNINWLRISKQGAIAAPVQVSAEELNFDVYPNPADGEIFIKSAHNFSDVKVRIVNFEGREVFTGSEEHINVAELSPGIYTIMLVKDGVHTTKRFIKK